MQHVNMTGAGFRVPLRSTHRAPNRNVSALLVMDKPHTRNGVIIAVAIAPLAVIPAWVAAWLVTHLFSIPPRFGSVVGNFLLVLLFSLPISYGVTLFIGLPGFLLLRRYRMHTLPMITCLAIAVVAVPWLYLAESPGEFVYGALSYGYFALWVAITAWAIAVWIPEKRSNYYPLNSDARATGARLRNTLELSNRSMSKDAMSWAVVVFLIAGVIAVAVVFG